MKNSDLIKILSGFDGDLEVTTSDKKGVFNDIKDVELQRWSSKGNRHASITLILTPCDKNKTKIKNSPIIEIDLNDDEEFIDNVNKNLKEGEKIEKEEALNAKNYFNVDFKEMQKKYKEWYEKRYDKIEHEAMTELFENDTPLENKTIGDLKYYIYKNGWQNELDKNELNNRAIVLRLLYSKLDTKVKEMLLDNVDNVWSEVNCKCKNGNCEKKKESIKDLFGWLDDWNKKLNQDLFADFESNFKDFSGFKNIFF